MGIKSDKTYEDIVERIVALFKPRLEAPHLLIDASRDSVTAKSAQTGRAIYPPKDDKKR